MSQIVYATGPNPAPKPKREPKAPPVAGTESKRGMIATILIASLIVHAAGLALFGLWVVAKKFARPEAVFEVREVLKVPIQKTPEHRMNVAQHEANAPKPVFDDKLVSTRPSDFALPELPKLDLQQMLPLDPSELVSDQVSSLVGTAGLGLGSGSGLSGSGGLGKGLTNFSFMGMKAQGRRILLLFDVSGSVMNKAVSSGVPIARIKEETLKLIDSLPPGAEFGLIQFVRNYKPFSDTLMPATPANRDAARQWVENEWSESGQMSRGQKGVFSPDPNGLPCVLEAAFAMNPDVIFLISDGQFEQTYPQDRRVPNEELDDQIKALQKGRAERLPIQFLGFQMRDEDQSDWSRIVRRTGGRLKEIRER